MRFTESKKRMPWVLLFIVLIMGVILSLGFCGRSPNPKMVQKTIVFEAD